MVKMCGNSPRKLFVRVMRNGDVKMNVFCFIFVSFSLDYSYLYSLLVVLLLCCFEMGFIKFLLGSVVVQ
jgi:hypothetical protein